MLYKILVITLLSLSILVNADGVSAIGTSFVKKYSGTFEAGVKVYPSGELEIVNCAIDLD